MDVEETSRKDHSPIYCQIAETLRRRIFSGELKPLAKLPGENELGELFNASRITIRSSLKKLETEGLIHRVNGKGTFVSEFKGRQRQMIIVLERDPSELRHLHELVMGALVKAQDDGFSVLVASAAQFRSFLEEAVSNPVRQTGVLLLRCREPDIEDIRYAEKHGIPCLLEGSERLKGFNWIAVDNEGAMRQVVEHLHGLGHRKFALVDQPVQYVWSSFKERREAALRRLAELGVPKRDIALHSLNPDGVLPESLLASDAIVCVNDVLAISIMNWLSGRGVKIPSEIAVTGFDDILPSRLAKPSLTTVCQDYFESGREAAAQLRSLMDDFDNKRIQLLRKLKLAIRESSAG